MLAIKNLLDQLSGAGQTLPTLVMLLAFVSVTLGVLATAGLVTNRGALRRRLQSEATVVTPHSELSLRLGEGRSWFERLLKPLAKILYKAPLVRPSRCASQHIFCKTSGQLSSTQAKQHMYQ